MLIGRFCQTKPVEELGVVSLFFAMRGLFQMWTILIMRIVTIIVTILIVFFCEQGSHPPVLPIQQPPNHHNKNPRWEVG